MYYAFFVFSHVLNRAKIPIFLAFHAFLPKKNAKSLIFFAFGRAVRFAFGTNQRVR